MAKAAKQIVEVDDFFTYQKNQIIEEYKELDSKVETILEKIYARKNKDKK